MHYRPNFFAKQWLSALLQYTCHNRVPTPNPAADNTRAWIQWTWSLDHDVTLMDDYVSYANYWI